MKKYYLILALTIVTFSIGFGFAVHAQSVSPSPSSTPTPTPTISPGVYPLTGWMWSSNIGYVKVNPTGSAGYDLIANSNGSSATISGYAWSTNIGWIKFGSLTGMPNVTGLPNSGNATLNQVTGAVTGWARACAATINSLDPNPSQPSMSGNCSTMTKRGDGWDGWIELSGTNHPSPGSGVTMNLSTGKFSGKAWGGDVIGWLEFNPNITYSGGGTITQVGCTGCGGTTGGPQIHATCTGSSDTSGRVTYNGTATEQNGGSGTYDYNWGAGYQSSNTLSTTTYNDQQVVTGPLLYVRDHVTQTLIDSDQCPSVVAQHPTGGGVTIQIGNTLSTLKNTTLTSPPGPLVVSQGNPFAMQVVNSLPPSNPITGLGYSCIAQTTGTNYWPSFWNNATAQNGGSNAALDTTNANTGSYIFKVDCTSQSQPEVSSSAYLKIRNVNEGEI